MRRSSTAVYETPTQHAVWWGRTSPDPGLSVAVELSGGEAGDVRDIVVVGEALAGVGGATKAPPPRLDEIEPARADGDEDLLNTRMGGEPVTDGTTRVTQKVVEPVEKSRCGCSSLGAEDALRAIHTLRAGILGGL